MDFMGLQLQLNPQLFHITELNAQEMVTDLSCILSLVMQNQIKWPNKMIPSPPAIDKIT